MTRPKPTQTDDTMLVNIDRALETLRLPRMREALHAQLAAPTPDLSRLEWLWTLLEPQMVRRVEARIERRIREAKLPVRKTLAAFDFDFQPQLDRDLVLELGTLRFLDERMNVLLAGWSGTGKSHIAQALALAACVANRRVRYTTSADMLAHLGASLVDNTFDDAIRSYTHPELLVVDEIGLEQIEKETASRSGLMQKVILPRYNERRSTAITSNIPWEAWGEYLGDQLGATALLDRLLHHSHVIVIEGPSYRDHEHKKQVEKSRKTPKARATPKK